MADAPASRQIVLVGAPGAGKSTVGRLVAERLDLPFTDVDALIEQQTQQSIADIFALEGEAEFRRQEEQATAQALTGAGVISLGGGAVLSARTRAALRGRTVVWLEVSAAQAIARAGLDQPRPLLLGNVRGTLISLLAQRTPLYAEVATHTVSADARGPATVVDLVLAALAADRGEVR